MKRIFILIFFVIATSSVSIAQYAKAYQKGKYNENDGFYYEAIRFYNAANVSRDKPDNNDIDVRIEFCANKLNQLRIEAENAKKEAEKSKNEAVNANLIAQRIIDAFYFYDDKYALAFDGYNYGFIDKKGNVKIEYRYKEALPFNKQTGLAKVNRQQKSFLIDTTGTEYLLSNIEDISSETEAVDLSSSNISEIPKIIYNYPQIKILLLNNNDINNLQTEIENLKELKILNLNENNITNIPPEVCNLKKLAKLNLAKNKLTYLPDKFYNLNKLIELDLSWNYLDTIPNQIFMLQNLVSLNMAHNNLNNMSEKIQDLQSFN